MLKKNKKILLIILTVFIFFIPRTDLGTNLYSGDDKNEGTSVDVNRLEFNKPKTISSDFKEIENRGTIRMITRYGPMSYYLMDGRDRGFEYEFVSRFAREHGLKVEVVLIDEQTDPIQYLESGKGDLIADYFVIQEELRDQVSFSAPYHSIHQTYDIREVETMRESTWDNPDEDIIRVNTQQHQSVADYFEVKSEGLTFKKSENIAWVTRKNSPVLKRKMDQFIRKHVQVRKSDERILRSAYLNNLRRHYYDKRRLNGRFYSRVYDALYTGYLSPYDDMVKPIAKEAGVDWILVIAVMAQESAFDPKAISTAGALGLMQIIPRFSNVEDKTELFDPKTNIREGVRYLKMHLNREADLDSLNRNSMALAAYNVGMGNLADARKLSAQMGNDPDDWPNIAYALLKLMEPHYHQLARYGYKNGDETVNYVEDVLNRYSRYQAIYKMAVLFRENGYQEMIVQKRN